MEKRTKITVRDLNLYYGENHALKDVNMNIRENCVTAFIGPSGCGKSTFLKTLNRMNDLVDGVRITGEVKLDDEDIYAEGVDTTVLRKRIGMVFQQPNPFPMSIYDNIAYGPRVHGMKDKSKLDASVEESLRGAAIFDEVKDRLKKSALGLSGGQQQRICIARALAVQPEVLLMDEPTSALDPISTSKIEELMEDLVRLKGAIKPHEILLVVDALTGQDAVNAAEGFNDRLGIDGIIMTKMDGDSRGGAALSAKKVTGRPVKFVGTGEKFDALEPFHPERMASRILGMGDMLTLIEKAQEDYDEQKAQDLDKRLRKNQFTLEDFLEQMGQIRKMGGIGKLLGMMPGMNSRAMQNVNVEQSERDFVQMEAIIQSMTREERENPSILNASRRKRIAAGSGQPVSKINQLVKRYDETRKMMKSFTGKGGAGRMNRMFRGM